MTTGYATPMTNQSNRQLPQHWAQGWAHCAFTPQPPIAYGTGETVLLAEQDATLLKLGKSLLEILGYRALTTNNDEQILKLCRTEKIELIICDMEIKRQSQEKEHLLKHIKELQPAIKILIASTYDVSLGSNCCPAVEDLPVLSKPFTVQSFSQTIRQCLGSTGE